MKAALKFQCPVCEVEQETDLDEDDLNSEISWPCEDCGHTIVVVADITVTARNP